MRGGFLKKVGPRILSSNGATTYAGHSGHHPRHKGGRDRCSGCAHPQREQLDADIVAGVSHRVLAVRYELSRSAIQRHQTHIPGSLVRLKAMPVPLPNGNGSTATSEDVVAEARRLYDDCRRALDGAVESGNLLGLSLAAREVHRSLDLLGRQLERIEARRGNLVSVLDLWRNEDWLAARAIIVTVLNRHPEAKRDLLNHLRALNERSVEGVSDDA